MAKQISKRCVLPDADYIYEWSFFMVNIWNLSKILTDYSG